MHFGLFLYEVVVNKEQMEKCYLKKLVVATLNYNRQATSSQLGLLGAAS